MTAPRTLRDRIQAAMMAQGTGGSWEERAARATEQWVEEQIADLRTLVVEMAEERARPVAECKVKRHEIGLTLAFTDALSRLTQRAEAQPRPDDNSFTDCTFGTPSTDAAAPPPAEPALKPCPFCGGAMQQVQARRPKSAPAVSLRLSSMPCDEKLAGWSAGSTVLADHERHRVMLWISTLRTAKTATGIALDRLADSISDISRWPGETDVTFRDRLQRALLG